LYELIDLPNGSTSADKGFGLLRADFSHKPSYTALASLLSLLADPGSSFAPADLAFQLTGDLTNVHHILFQKRNGWFYLALWVEEPAYDVDGKKSITVKPRQVIVHTTKETGGVMRTFDASGVLKSAELPGSTTHSVQVSDSVSILEIGNYPVPPIMNVPVVQGPQ
jgi:hypothetical protein